MANIVVSLLFLSRYHYPTVGRFISQDDADYADYEAINGLNLYAYCNNNPVMYSDPTGHFVITVGMLITGLIIGASVCHNFRKYDRMVNHYGIYLFNTSNYIYNRNIFV